MREHNLVTMIEDGWLQSPEHIPDEPYRGIAVLFNGDLHTLDPEDAPREAWVVLAPGVLHRKGHVLIGDRYYPADAPVALHYLEHNVRIAQAYDEVESALSR